MSYEGIDLQSQYLDLSRHHLGIHGILSVLEDLLEDHLIQHVNLSYNILLEEWSTPLEIETFLKKVRKLLSRNKTLTALDLAGNYLFYYHPHPNNEHIKNYEKELAKLLKDTTITHLDLSENYMTGLSGRELDGLIYFSKQFVLKRKAFQCRRNQLTSQGLFALIHGLGVYSTLTYLDISDNEVGKDPLGRANGEGLQALAMELSKSLKLKYLKIARNYLLDEHISYLGQAIEGMPYFLDLDLTGNLCKVYGCRALKLALASHGVPHTTMAGFRSLSLSNNPIGDEGIIELCFAIERTQTLRTVSLHGCHLTDRGGQALQKALMQNSSIVLLDITENQLSEEQTSLTMAESLANQMIEDIRSHPMEIDADEFNRHVYLAVVRKLHFVEKVILEQLHQNPSFNRAGTEMMDELYILSPPPRKLLVAEVKKIDPTLIKRLEESKILARKVDAALKIFDRVMTWYSEIRRRRNIAQALDNINNKKEFDFMKLFMGEDYMSFSSGGSVGGGGDGSHGVDDGASLEEEGSIVSGSR